MLSTLATYRLMARDLDRTLALKAAEAPVALEIENFRERIGQIKSIDAFLADTRVFKFAMTAFGLEDMAYAKGYMRKVLTEGVDDPQAFANRVSDNRFVAFARTFNFAKYGEIATATPTVRQPVVDLYVRQRLEVSAGEDNEGVRLALYFQRMAPSVDNPYEILADNALAEVVFNALQIPNEVRGAPIERQASIIEERLDLESLRDPDAVDRLLIRFSNTWDATREVEVSPLVSLFSNQRSASINLDLVLSLQTLRRGGP